MVKSSNNYLEEDEEADLYDKHVNRNNSSSYKGEGKSSEQKATTHRSKHSETEQRRRSKINERFQMLRDLIPQNDQKRDKASFLLERSHNGPAETYMDQSQVIKNGSGHENSVINPGMLSNPQNSMESDLDTAAAYKATDFSPGSATTMVPQNMHAQQNMFAPVGRGGMPTQPLQESVSDVENMVYQPQTQLWQGRSCATECAVPNGALNDQDLMIESGSSSMSNAYSQGILNALTQALRSSGVDLSQASVSVQIDVGKRANDGSTAMASSSKDNDSHYQNNQVMAQTGVRSFNEDSDRTHKRLRTELS
ncbi:transcription factor BIM3 [Citrus sinensis]|nr:transcription factor BIM3 [Citrus sinensis]